MLLQGLSTYEYLSPCSCCPFVCHGPADAGRASPGSSNGRGTPTPTGANVHNAFLVLISSRPLFPADYVITSVWKTFYIVLIVHIILDVADFVGRCIQCHGRLTPEHWIPRYLSLTKTSYAILLRAQLSSLIVLGHFHYCRLFLVYYLLHFRPSHRFPSGR